ncbi:unknown protein [Simkania negevensis Z]|uniref:Uncharacterized protein n=1 Tax=Simkania negevensis (strain ATCC VR-1471 / DSM 27360 / Z) TaxID=331113 RepID=F8L4M3_SIMNZ|nr:unknown protein [Simkania negevensis Z]
MTFGTYFSLKRLPVLPPNVNSHLDDVATSFSKRGFFLRERFKASDGVSSKWAHEAGKRKKIP